MRCCDSYTTQEPHGIQWRQPEPLLAVVSAPLRACLLSGGFSRRMGRDKAQLPHSGGGTWLDHALRQLQSLNVPISLLSRWPQHLTQAGELDPGILRLMEPEPQQGPLLALHRLMVQHPDQRLLLCPVDMPQLTPAVLAELVTAAAAEPEAIHVAHDGKRCQPLLGIYPSDAPRRERLQAAIAAGERKLQRWLASEEPRTVPLAAGAIRNVNRPDELRELHSCPQA